MGLATLIISKNIKEEMWLLDSSKYFCQISIWMSLGVGVLTGGGGRTYCKLILSSDPTTVSSLFY